MGMDSESWFWRHEPRIRQAARFLGLIGLFAFLGCLIVLLRGAFMADRMWLFGGSVVAWGLMLVGFGTQVDDAKDEGYAKGLSDGLTLGKAMRDGAPARPRTRAVEGPSSQSARLPPR